MNLKSGSLAVITLLHKGLSHIHSQEKPSLHFGERFTSMFPLRGETRGGRSQISGPADQSSPESGAET